MNAKVRSWLFKRSMWTLLSVFFALMMIILLIATPITQANYPFIDTFFGVSRTRLVEKGNTEDQDTIYYKSNFAKKDENGNLVYKENSKSDVKQQDIDRDKMREYSMEIAERVNEEGSVLLWNNKMSDGNAALPLSKGDKVSALGVGSINWQYHGLGSGFVTIESDELLSMQAAFTADDVGLQFNETMPGIYEEAKKRGAGISLGNTVELAWSGIKAAGKESIAEYGDAAIYVLSRYYGEGFDSNDPTNLSSDNSRLTLAKNEISVLEGLKTLKDQGKVKKVIVVINNASPFNLKYLTDAKYGVDACLWVGWGGSTSLSALADILVGNADPSGHLTDTWAYDVKSAPSTANFGNFEYSPITQEVPAERRKYVVYQEGIYVGYRYYETRYEDTVLGKGNAAYPAGAVMNTEKWNYADEVAYTFGYGSGYTEFSYSDYSVKKSGDRYNVSVKVTNTGKKDGKDAVQIYLQKPYTQYDIDHKIEKSSVELVGFEKTDVIEAGGSRTVTVSVPEYEFKCYDSEGQGTYILEKGDYYLAAGQDAHDALNNILAAKGYTVEKGMDADGNAKLASKHTYTKNDFDTYSRSPYGKKTKIVNRFDNADINKFEGMAGQSITYLSRSNWKDTYSGGVTLKLDNAALAAQLKYVYDVPDDSGKSMPKYKTVTSEYGALKLIQLKDLKYDDPLWDDLLNQMTFEEQQKLTQSCANSGVKSIAAPGISQQDGPCGNRSSHMALPCNPIVASTFDKKLVEELGVVFGSEMMNNGITGIYGVGANTHRNPYGGRAWEYFSEDGFLGGAINSYYSKGMSSMGVILFTKHFALNDQERNRGNGIHTWSNEQAIREIYLKAFETAITDGYCNGLMTSFNSLGGLWVGQHKGLLTDVLRGEWGFTGITITDAVGTNAYMGAGKNSIIATALIAGQDAWMGGMNADALEEYYQAKNATVCQALRESAHRILYTQVRSMAMNGMSSTTDVYIITPAWETALFALTLVSGLLMGACLVMVGVSWLMWYLEKRKNLT